MMDIVFNMTLLAVVTSSREFPLFPVAVGTLKKKVNSRQHKVVMKRRANLPALFVVTAGTFFTKFTIMNIFVA